LTQQITPLRVIGTIVLVLVVTTVILLNVPSSDYILLPDIAHPVAPLVKVEGGREPPGGGGIYFLDVIERRANEFEKLFPWIHSDATFVPASVIVPPGSSSAAVQAADLREMSMSQRIAAAVALRKLGRHVVVRPNGVIVNVLGSGTDAARKLQPADVIVEAAGKPTPTIASLRQALSRVTPGEVVDIRVKRGSKLLTEPVRTVADRREPDRALIGFEPAQAAEIKLPIRVSIDAQGVGGPSAGLAFALEIMSKLGRNVTHGYRVAATGQMNLDGTVSAIGGVRQKVVDAQRAGVDVLLAPVDGGNARVARRYARHLRVIPVRTLGQALHALAALPPKQ